MNIQLTEDDKEELKVLIEMDEYKVLIKKVIPQLIRGQLEYLATAPDESLIKERDAYKGMEKLYKKILELKAFLNK